MSSVQRFSATAVEDGGTPEAVWAAAPTLPDLDDRPCPSLVLVAPHPDDEILGVGGWAGMLALRGVPVAILSVTDGDASHPGSPTVTRAELATRRQAESDRAAVCLGLPGPTRLHLPDGAVAEHEYDLSDWIRGHLAEGAWCVAPLRTDGHPDHEATGRAAARAADAAGSVFVEYPIWMWHWSSPRDPAGDWHRARRISLTPDIRARKASAVEMFTSQIADLSEHPADRAVLPPHVLARLLRDHETVFVP